MTNINIYPNEKFKKMIEAEAKRQSRSVNNLLLLILKNYFEGKLKKTSVGKG